MKGIIITENNIKDVLGRLNKQLSNHKIFYWHNFNCGFKKNIKPYSRIKYYYIKLFEIVDGYSSTQYIRLLFDSNNGIVINTGDKIAFSGGKIIIKSKFILGGYIYNVLQPYSKNILYRGGVTNGSW